MPYIETRKSSLSWPSVCSVLSPQWPSLYLSLSERLIVRDSQLAPTENEWNTNSILKAIPEPVPGIHFCAADPTQHPLKLGIIWAYWWVPCKGFLLYWSSPVRYSRIPIMTLEVILFGLAAYQLFLNIRAFGADVLKPSTGGLISVILRDAIWYFVLWVHRTKLRHICWR